MKGLKYRLCQMGVNVCRLVLALTFIFSGTVKLIDPLGFQYKLEDYADQFGVSSFMPAFVPICLAVALAMLEFILGINLFFGIRRRLTSLVTLLFMLVVTPLTLYIALTGVVVDCGCFGDALVLTNWQTFGKNVVLLAAAVAVVCRPGMMLRFISERNQWTISIYSFAYALALALYCIYRLPVIDFRPYHLGVDLATAVENEWDNPAEKPVYADFYIDTEEEGDITLQWLAQPGYKFILAAPYLETADEGAIDEINNIFEYCEDYGYPFLCLTGSGSEAIERWMDRTGAEYPFASTDAIVLKTMIRSNPGLLLLDGGVVVNKWPASALPDSRKLTAPLQDLQIGQPQRKDFLHASVRLLLWFFIPLLVFALVDRIWTGGKYLQKYRQKFINLKKQKEHEKEDCSRQLEDEPELARGCGSRH
ncbi:MAG: DoxX family protein [Prevotellaceae bacterium]|nr:DoxX family protein [Prevotellaceae bacterium]